MAVKIMTWLGEHLGVPHLGIRTDVSYNLLLLPKGLSMFCFITNKTK